MSASNTHTRSIVKSEADARAAVQRMVQQAQDRARAAHQMVDELESLRIVGQSRTGTRVTLSHSGSLLEVKLGDRLGQGDLRQIEQSIAEANSDAQFKLKQSVTDLAARHYGDGSETATHFSGEYDKLFPNAAESDKPDNGRGGGVLR